MANRHSKLIYQAAFAATLVALLCVLVMGFGIGRPESAASLQPTQPGGPTTEFLRPINRFPERVLRFMAADTLFVLSYVWLFAGLAVSVVDRSPVHGWLGLGAGVLAAALDAAENAFLITYALLAQNGAAVTEPALPLIYVLANLKWMGAFGAMYAFGLVWARDTRLGWALSIVMLLFPLLGALGVAQPDLVEVRGLFFLLGLPLFAWHFWREAHVT